MGGTIDGDRDMKLKMEEDMKEEEEEFEYCGVSDLVPTHLEDSVEEVTGPANAKLEEEQQHALPPQSTNRRLRRAKSDSDDAYPVKCPQCEKDIAFGAFRKHMRTAHHGQCLVCEYKVGENKKLTSYYVKVHMTRMHTFGEYACQSCAFRAIFPQDLARHANAEHGPDSETACNVCKELVVAADYLGHHEKCRQKKHVEWRAQCTKRSKSVCDLCGKSYSSSSALKTHKYQVHTEYKPFQVKINSDQDLTAQALFVIFYLSVTVRHVRLQGKDKDAHQTVSTFMDFILVNLFMWSALNLIRKFALVCFYQVRCSRHLL
jgi:hypothetical protein